MLDGCWYDCSSEWYFWNWHCHLDDAVDATASAVATMMVIVMVLTLLFANACITYFTAYELLPTRLDNVA